MNTLEKDFVNYNQALEMNALGFNEPCFGRYDGKGNNKGKLWYEMPNSGQDTIPVGDVLAPTFSQAFRFFRDKKGLHVIYTKGVDWNNYYWQIWRNDTMTKTYVCSSDYVYDTYEEAEIDCLDKLIEIAKNR